MNLDERIRNDLKRAIAAKKLSGLGLAQKIGVNQSIISRFLAGQPIMSSTLGQIAKELEQLKKRK